jgi:hypothetical protein
MLIKLSQYNANIIITVQNFIQVKLYTINMANITIASFTYIDHLSWYPIIIPAQR